MDFRIVMNVLRIIAVLHVAIGLSLTEVGYSIRPSRIEDDRNFLYLS